eukprot:TRINITY_DN32756_c0_g1_i1.p1 TRINITY_DN32756_c0_g1~~TRINITY_DN32756_c0_g1_i1.p1  ORF type:complete len:428 (+),score=146.58 TRINITY_DN32756_c0_g1_i1:69-1286(+)
MLDVDLDSTVAFLKLKHAGDWDLVSRSFAAFLNFAATLGGDEAAMLRHVDPMSFTPRILENRWEYWCWRKQQSREKKARTVPALDGQACDPSGFNILKDSLRDQVQSIHQRVQDMLPSLEGDDSDSSGSEDEMPEVFFSGYDWSKVRLPGDAGWESPTAASPERCEAAQSPPKVVPSIQTEPAKVAAGNVAKEVAKGESLGRGVLRRGFVKRPFCRPSECEDPEEEFLQQLERTAPDAWCPPEQSAPERVQPKAGADEDTDELEFLKQLERTAPDVPTAWREKTEERPARKATAETAPQAEAWRVTAADGDSDDEAVPDPKPVPKPVPKPDRFADKRRHRWTVVEHSDDSDDEPAAPADGKGKGKGKGAAVRRPAQTISARRPQPQAPEPHEIDCRPMRIPVAGP